MTIARMRLIFVAAAAVSTGLASPVLGAPAPGEPAASASPPAPGRASAPDELAWDPRWRRVDAVELGATAAVGAGALLAYVFAEPTPRWTAISGFDRGVRDGLRLSSPGARNAARAVSDFLLAMQTAFVLGVDPIFAAWLGHGRRDVAEQLLFMDLEVLALTSAVDIAVVDGTGRERPYGASCVSRDASSSDCTDRRRYQSFFSGHSTTTFAAAGLTCAHHARMPLWGGGLRDAFACAGTVGVAAATATLRVASDQHWATDVLVGSAFGFAAGYGLPSLLHYRAGGVDVAGVVTPFGAFAAGRF
jgi:hypothetical protein